MSKNKTPNCKICKDNKNIKYFSIENFKQTSICDNCADRILLKQLKNNLEKKWKTYRELKYGKKVDLKCQ